MIEAIIEQMILLKTMVVVTAVCTVALTVCYFVFCRRFSWVHANTRVIGFFYDMNMSDTFILAVCMLKLFLVISLLFNKGRIETIHICFFGVLVLVYNLFRHRVKDMAVSIFNGFVIMGVLFVSNLLLSYLREVLFDFKIAAALVFLAFFLLLYAAYDVGYCILSIVDSREKRDKKVNRDQLEEKADRSME